MLASIVRSPFKLLLILALLLSPWLYLYLQLVSLHQTQSSLDDLYHNIYNDIKNTDTKLQNYLHSLDSPHLTHRRGVPIIDEDLKTRIMLLLRSDIDLRNAVIETLRQTVRREVERTAQEKRG